MTVKTASKKITPEDARKLHDRREADREERHQAKRRKANPEKFKAAEPTKATS
jgi:hypothetical protein